MPLLVLIVEDEALIALDIQDILQSGGHTVVGVASSAAEAAWMARKFKPQLAIVDVGLKGGDSGIDVAAELGAKLRIPALFLTGNSDFLVRAMALDIEPLGYVVKPFTSEDILAPLRTAQ